MRYRFHLLFLAAFFALCRASGAELSAEDFLERVRHPYATESYANLKGIIQHRPSGGRMETLPVVLTVRIRSGGVRSELLINGEEGYRITQDFSGAAHVEPFGSALRPNPFAGRFGIRPTDLTMSFLFYRLVREESGTLVKGVPCRLLLLEAPDKGEAVRVYAARRHFFPLKAEFYASMETLSRDPVRTLETGSFRKKNELYYAEILNLYGTDWRSRIYFQEADLGVPAAASVKSPSADGGKAGASSVSEGGE